MEEENWDKDKIKLSVGTYVIPDNTLGKITEDQIRGYICAKCGKTITEAYHIKPTMYGVLYNGENFYLERHHCKECGSFFKDGGE